MITPDTAPPGSEVVCIEQDRHGVLSVGSVYLVERWVSGFVNGNYDIGILVGEVTSKDWKTGKRIAFRKTRFRPLDLGRLDELLIELREDA